MANREIVDLLEVKRAKSDEEKVTLSTGEICVLGGFENGIPTVSLVCQRDQGEPWINIDMDLASARVLKRALDAAIADLDRSN